MDAALVQAASLAKEVAPYRHTKLAAVRIAGEIKRGPPDDASLDELLDRIKAELVKLGPILDLEVVGEPQGSRTEAA